MKDILTKVEKINIYFRTASDQTDKERFLQRIVKLNEEVGELCEAALAEVDPDQRKKDRETDFDAELADVVITTLMLSIDREKNVSDEIHKKLDNVLNRFNIT